MGLWAGMSANQKEDYDGAEFWSNLKHTGWLMKQTWRRRWFVLKRGKPFWFKESMVIRDSSPRGLIPVANYVTVKGAENILNKLNAFQLSTQYETMFFIADSDNEMGQWIHTIRRTVVQHSRSIANNGVVDYKSSKKY